MKNLNTKHLLLQKEQILSGVFYQKQKEKIILWKKN